MEILLWKKIMTEMKTTMDRFNIRLDTAEKKIHKLEARPEKNREIKERPKDGERKQETKYILWRVLMFLNLCPRLGQKWYYLTNENWRLHVCTHHVLIVMQQLGEQGCTELKILYEGTWWWHYFLARFIPSWIYSGIPTQPLPQLLWCIWSWLPLSVSSSILLSLSDACYGNH